MDDYKQLKIDELVIKLQRADKELLHQLNTNYFIHTKEETDPFYYVAFAEGIFQHNKKHRSEIIEILECGSFTS